MAGSRGRIEVKEDFMGFTITTMATTQKQMGKLLYSSVEEGSFATTVNEPGGVLSAVTDTAANSNVCLHTMPFVPADGGCWMETRFKLAVVTTPAIFVGFQGVVDASTPVMGVEFATESAVYNDAIASTGFSFDIDATTDIWRAVGGAEGVAVWDADSLATKVGFNSQAPVADEYDVVRVEIEPDGTAHLYMAASDGSLQLIKSGKVWTTPGAVAYPVLIVENRTAAANTVEVDYFNCSGTIDWTQ